MDKEAAPADEDLQPLSFPKFLNLEELRSHAEARKYVNALAVLPKCMAVTSHSKAVVTRCDCLHKHEQNDKELARRVARGIANFAAKKKTNKIQTLITWIHYADILASHLNSKCRQFSGRDEN